jgi:hypothetical protein
LLKPVVNGSPAIGDALADQVRELLVRSSRITRRSAILVESSQHARARDTLVAHCAWCGKVRVGGVWAVAEEIPDFLAELLANRRTHGICPVCLEDLQQKADDAPLPPTVVLIRAAGPLAVECLSRSLGTYKLRERPSFAIEATLPDATGAAVSALLSTVSRCLDENALGPVSIELSDHTYVLGEAQQLHGAR